jgi:hypothetical protein
MKEFYMIIIFLILFFVLFLLKLAFSNLKKQRAEFLAMYSNLVKVFNESNAEVHSEINKILRLIPKKREYKKPYTESKQKGNEKKTSN